MYKLIMKQEFESSIKKMRQNFTKNKVFIICFCILAFRMLDQVSDDRTMHHQFIRQNSKANFKQLNFADSSQPQNINPNPKLQMNFLHFKLKYYKKYDNMQQNLFRSIVYVINIERIQKHNSKKDRTFNMEVNQFADFTVQEFAQKFTATFASNEVIRKISNHYVDRASKEGSKSVQSNSTNRKKPSAIGQKGNGKNMIKQNLEDSLEKKLNLWKKQKTESSTVEQLQKRFHQNLIQTIQNQVFLIKQAKQRYFDGINQIQETNDQSTSPNYENSRILGQIYQIQDEIKNTERKVIWESFTEKQNTKELLQTQMNFTDDYIDWTPHAGSIRSQGMCGACYTFATSDAVSSLYSIHRYGFFVPFSTQQIVDCSENGLTFGCNGGFLEGSYTYMQVKGITSDYLYPYYSSQLGNSGQCKEDGGSIKITSFRNIDQGNCQSVIRQLRNGPLSIGIAGYRLQFYSEGIFNDCNSLIDHAVVLISYREGTGWKIKNSWGHDWGLGGFGWIADGNNCGICDMAVAVSI